MHCIAYHYITLHNIHNITLKKLRWYPLQPQRCNILLFLFLQIFLKRAAKPSLGNTSGGFPWIKWPQIPLNLIWLCAKASQTFSGTFSGTLLSLTWLCTKASRNLLRNLFRNPVEPDLALHQSLQPSPGPCWTWPGSAPKPPGTFSGTFGTFSGTSLNLTRRLHQCTLELFLAEDPISLRCWGITLHTWHT